jgi:hypothetical protein
MLCVGLGASASALAQDQPTTPAETLNQNPSRTPAQNPTQTETAPVTAAPAAPTISTDRPAITDSSVVVADGYFVFENGFTETGTTNHLSLDTPETLVRFGLTSKTELRFMPPDYFYNFNTGRGYGDGFGDIGFGVKQQIFATASGFDASVIVQVSVPTGAKIISSHGYDPQVLVPWSHTISKNWTAAGMFSFLAPTENGSHDPTGQVSFLIDRQITGRSDAFVEYGGEFPQHSGPQHVIHAGASLRITDNQQLDIHAGWGLSSAAVNHFLGFGYSFQFQAFRREKRSGS